MSKRHCLLIQITPDRFLGIKKFLEYKNTRWNSRRILFTQNTPEKIEWISDSTKYTWQHNKHILFVKKPHFRQYIVGKRARLFFRIPHHLFTLDFWNIDIPKQITTLKLTASIQTADPDLNTPFSLVKVVTKKHRHDQQDFQN